MDLNTTGVIKTALSPLDTDHECTIIESVVDYLIQALLGVLAFATLITKWRMEARDGKGNQRPTRVFVLDTTKQGGGFFIAHVGNMVVASLLAADDVSPCVWYFVNIVFDTTVRVLFAYLLLRVIEWIIRVHRLDPKGVLDFGDYGDLYVLTCTSLKRWAFQLVLWIGIVIITVVMKGMLVWAFQQPLAAWGSWILGPLEDHTKEHGHSLELVTVMMIIPFIMCAMQLWIQDSFLQSKKRGQGLHRFDEDALNVTGREYRPSEPAPEPIFLIADAMWGPDSHRYGPRKDSQMTLPVPLPVPEPPAEASSDGENV
eukprot:TRINITY_DN15365_c0_g1_i1.p1 TRINITY_DN15365_c0_g1~~TRINITY_DN15365_c0_g1_i1.p1  ORF type:complete len:314 (+),score=42.18 TRINITY_DN15365_c0_g1_i1:33-974(+)